MHLTRVFPVLGIPVACLLALEIGPSPAASPRPPNILLILVDDLGREWLSCYGSPCHQTPHIDALARQGVRFENVYATPLCTPSRAELLTGRYPFRTGWTVHHDVPRWGGKYFDWTKEVTFARVLKSAGYATAISGKWQLNDLRLQPDALAQHGFDEHCVWPGGESGGSNTERYWDPLVQINGRRPSYKGRFGPDVFDDFATDFMRRHRDQPFLLYYPMVLTHLTEVAAKGGTGVVQPPGYKGTDLRAETLFGAMIDYMDRLVGHQLEALDRLKLRDNTVVIFTTDNGTARAFTCGKDGAEVKGAKGQLSEAGIRVPLIVSGPRVPRGRVTQELVDFSDVLATLADLTQARLPPNVVLDGHSFAASLRDSSDATVPPRPWIFSQYGPVRVIRDERYKLYSNGKLFDVAQDPSESHDLTGRTEPEIAAERQKLAGVLASLPPDVDPGPPHRAGVAVGPDGSR